MSYVELQLLSYRNKSVSNLSSVIEESDFIVILGSPGSGKTTLLKHYQKKNNSNAKIIQVMEFAEFQDEEITEDVLLLDGLDEYKTTSTNNNFIIAKLSKQLNKYAKDKKIVLSCREMDWYGDEDSTALKEKIDREPQIYSICPLDESRQRELATQNNINDFDDFQQKFNVFLSNPQMFSMAVELSKSAKIASSRSDLYREFILSTREKNRVHKDTSNSLCCETTMRLVGYLAFYYIFSNVSHFTDRIIEQIEITDQEELLNYKADDLRQILGTQIFDGEKFTHRTIAEFACASYIHKELMTKRQISPKRILSLFELKENKIPTTFRGVFAWLCSISKTEQFYEIDPYYQLVNGDCTLFNSTEKVKILEYIKSYAKNKNPYFLIFTWSTSLHGFYSSTDAELTKYFISYFKDYKRGENSFHFSTLLAEILADNALQVCAEDGLVEVIKSSVLSSDVEPYLAQRLMSVFKYEPDMKTLNYFFNKINECSLTSRYKLFSKLLTYLYPNYINCQDAIRCIKLYQADDDMIGEFYFLTKTRKEDQYEMVDFIHQNYDFNDIRVHRIPYEVRHFTNEYFSSLVVDTIAGKMTKEELYIKLKYFKKYYKPFRTFSYSQGIVANCDQNALQDLANDLFILFVKDEDNNIKNSFTYAFEHFFPFKRSKLAFNKLVELFHELTNNKKKILFYELCYHIDKNSFELERISKNAHELEEIYNNSINPKKSPYELEHAEHQAEIKQQHEEERKKNAKEIEQLYSWNNSLEEHFGVMDFISNFIYFAAPEEVNNHLYNTDYELLHKDLANVVVNEVDYGESLYAFDSIIENACQFNRQVDKVYYASLSLNNYDILKDRLSLEFKSYLYILSCHKSRLGGIVTSEFASELENIDPVFCLEILKKLTNQLLANYLYQSEDIYNNSLLYKNVIKEINDISKLKKIIYIYYDNETSYRKDLIFYLLSTYPGVYSSEIIRELEGLNTKANSIGLLIKFIDNNIEDFTISDAIIIYKLLFNSKREFFIFDNLNSSLRINIIAALIGAYSSNEDIEYSSGLQSAKQQCGSFLREYALDILNPEELTSLYKSSFYNKDVWSDRILYAMSKSLQKAADSIDVKLEIDKLRNFIIAKHVVSQEDFFSDFLEK